MAADRPFISGVVLAAGASTRMGRPKQLLELDGKPLLQHVTDAAGASRLDELIVVLGHEAGAIRAAIELPPSAKVVVNDDYEAGQSTSLRRGLREVDTRADAIAVLVGDQPSVEAQTIDRVLDVFCDGNRPIVRPAYGDAPGHPVVLARQVWPELERLEGDQGARALIAEHPEWLLHVPLDGAPPPDIDTPADFERAAGHTTRTA